MRRSSTVYTLLLVLLAFPLAAQPSPDGVGAPFSVEGNWIVEYHGYPEEGATSKSALAIARPWQLVQEALPQGGSRWFQARQSGPWKMDKMAAPGFLHWGGGNITVTGGSVRIDHPTLMLGNWGGVSEVQSTGSNILRGQWNYREEASGNEVWRRVIPRVTSTTFIYENVRSETLPSKPAYVEVPYSGPGNSMRGNRPRFQVVIGGEDLWGHQVVDLGGAVDLEPLPPRYLYGEDPDQGLGHITGLIFDVFVWPEARSGRKTLWVNDQAIPFDLVIQGSPYETPSDFEREWACDRAHEATRDVGDEMVMPELWDGWDTLEAIGDGYDEFGKKKPMEVILMLSMDALIERMVKEKNAEKLARLEAVYKRKLLRFMQSKGLFPNKRLPKITRAEIEALKEMYRYSPTFLQRHSAMVETWKSMKRLFSKGPPNWLRGRLGRAITAKLFSKVYGPVSTLGDLLEIYEFVVETEKLRKSWETALENMEQAEGCNYELYEFRKNLTPEERRAIEELRRREVDYFRRYGLPPPIYPPWPGEAIPVGS